ncbi:Protein CBG10618 [Caenorhabditis briggsae]|uniref:Protein CBG10618 n=1 Tax=Caenorhabditis briggsae TaxID=6238 RepID=A8XBH1_CAEBR|nr:Protein CBG10618 [Caenorhabditis briggsae]CAP29986.2 Protein CBG10618 [Caenorhabditis briggsae]
MLLLFFFKIVCPEISDKIFSNVSNCCQENEMSNDYVTLRSIKKEGETWPLFLAAHDVSKRTGTFREYRPQFVILAGIIQSNTKLRSPDFKSFFERMKLGMEETNEKPLRVKLEENWYSVRLEIFQSMLDMDVNLLFCYCHNVMIYKLFRPPGKSEDYPTGCRMAVVPYVIFKESRQKRNMVRRYVGILKKQYVYITITTIPKMFIDHMVSSIRFHGSPLISSASSFERLNQTLRRSSNAYTTRTLMNISDRFMGMKRASEHCSSSLYQKEISTPKTMSAFLDDNDNDIVPEEKCDSEIITEEEKAALENFYINGKPPKFRSIYNNGKHTFSTRRSCMQKTVHNCYVYLKDNRGLIAFGSIERIFSTPSECTLVSLQNFETVDPFRQFSNYFNQHSFSNNLSHILNKANDYFRKIVDCTFKVVNAKSLEGFVTLFEYYASKKTGNFPTTGQYRKSERRSARFKKGNQIETDSETSPERNQKPIMRIKEECVDSTPRTYLTLSECKKKYPELKTYEPEGRKKRKILDAHEYDGMEEEENEESDIEDEIDEDEKKSLKDAVKDGNVLRVGSTIRKGFDDQSISDLQFEVLLVSVLKNALNPPYHIWNYSYRPKCVRSTDKHFQLLPEQVSDTLLDFSYDVVGVFLPDHLLYGKISENESFLKISGDPMKEIRRRRDKRENVAETSKSSIGHMLHV